MRRSPAARVAFPTGDSAIKRPWIAAVLALTLGGPGCFYLGWRRGVTATLVWLILVWFVVVGEVRQNGLDPYAAAIAFFFLWVIQAPLAWPGVPQLQAGQCRGSRGLHGTRRLPATQDRWRPGNRFVRISVVHCCDWLKGGSEENH